MAPRCRDKKILKMQKNASTTLRQAAPNFIFYMWIIWSILRLWEILQSWHTMALPRTLIKEPKKHQSTTFESILCVVDLMQAHISLVNWSWNYKKPPWELQDKTKMDLRLSNHFKIINCAFYVNIWKCFFIPAHEKCIYWPTFMVVTSVLLE